MRESTLWNQANGSTGSGCVDEYVIAGIQRLKSLEVVVRAGIGTRTLFRWLELTEFWEGTCKHGDRHLGKPLLGCSRPPVGSICLADADVGREGARAEPGSGGAQRIENGSEGVRDGGY